MLWFSTHAEIQDVPSTHLHCWKCCFIFLATETLCCDVAVVFQTNVVRTKYWIIVLIMKPNALVGTSVTATVYSKWKVKVKLEANTHSLQA